jgi:SAM-dependent methyltransferase
MGFVHPQPAADELQAIYGAEYFRRGLKYGSGAGIDPAQQANYNFQVAEVMQSVSGSGPRLLDVGCARGGFVKTALENGLDAWGIEPSAAAVNEAVAPPERVRCAHLAEAGFDAGSFDCVTMWDVFEHVPDPAGTLQRIAGLLRPGGRLFFTTGDFASFWARLSGRYWPLLTPPQHLFFYTQKSVRHILANAGFDLVSIRHPGKRVRLGLAFLKASEACPLLSSPLSRLAGGPFASRSVYINLGDIMLVTAVKRAEG